MMDDDVINKWIWKFNSTNSINLAEIAINFQDILSNGKKPILEERKSNVDDWFLAHCSRRLAIRCEVITKPNRW